MKQRDVSNILKKKNGSKQNHPTVEKNPLHCVLCMAGSLDQRWSVWSSERTFTICLFDPAASSPPLVGADYVSSAPKRNGAALRWHCRNRFRDEDWLHAKWEWTLLLNRVFLLFHWMRRVYDYGSYWVVEAKRNNELNELWCQNWEDLICYA